MGKKKAPEIAPGEIEGLPPDPSSEADAVEAVPADLPFVHDPALEFDPDAVEDPALEPDPEFDPDLQVRDGHDLRDEAEQLAWWSAVRDTLRSLPAGAARDAAKAAALRGAPPEEILFAFEAVIREDARLALERGRKMARGQGPPPKGRSAP